MPFFKLCGRTRPVSSNGRIEKKNVPFIVVINRGKKKFTSALLSNVHGMNVCVTVLMGASPISNIMQ